MSKLHEAYDNTSFDENPFVPDTELQTNQYTIVCGQKRFEYHTGKSKLDTVVNRDLSRLFDIRLSTNDHPNCCEETEKIYQAYREGQNNNIYITEISGAVEISNKALFDKKIFLNPRKLCGMDCPEGNFNNFMLYTLADYYQNC